MGQNFLISRTVLEKLIEAADLSRNDTVLEVGAGVGTITVELAKRVKKVIAVEKDPKLVKALNAVLESFNNVEIAQGDIRKLTLQLYGSKAGYKIIGNLPFYLTNYLIRKFLEMENPPKEMILIIQKEVAERICATSPQMSLLTISVQYYGEPKIISYVPKKSFWPQPEVDGAILAIKLSSNRAIKFKYKEQFFKVVKAGFSHPRKYLISNLSKGLKISKVDLEKIFKKINIDFKARAGDLDIKDWIGISKQL